MGYATTRTLERVAAAMGALESAPVEFQPTCDVAAGGVLVAVPALLAQGLLRHRPPSYRLPKGFYGIDSIFLVLALMALARVRSLEQLRYQAPGEWGKVLGLDRIPEVRTLREKIEWLCQDLGRALEWNAALAKEWMARQDMDGQPFLYVNKEVDPGLIATLGNEVIPWLEKLAPKSPEIEQRLAKDPRAHWFTVIFDREGYSPKFFAQLFEKRIAVLTYHKFPQENWRVEEFTPHRVQLAGGQAVTMKLAERGTRLSNNLWVRQIRKLTDSGHQTALLTTHFSASLAALAGSLFARWSQENFFRYMREHYGLDRLVARLRTERKHFVDTIKMIAYRAETSLVSLLREHLARSDDARTLVRQIFGTEADLLPDTAAKTLTVRIHHLTQAAHDQVLEQLCAVLNETQTVFPGTDLTLIFKIGSSCIP